MIKYLVTGTGRCGTVCLAKFFTSIGIDCTHEAIFTPLGLDYAKRALAAGCSNSVPSKREGLKDISAPLAESSMYAAPFLQDSLLKDVAVIHLVRHPLKVVKSFFKDVQLFSEARLDLPTHKHSEFLFSHIPFDTSHDSALKKVCFFYIFWNSLIERTAPSNYLRLRIEDGPKELLDFVSCTAADYCWDSTANSFKKRHTESKDLAWNDIPQSMLKELSDIAARYGYK